VFQGPHVSLRAIEADDIADLHPIITHKDMCGRRYIDDEDRPLSLRDVERALEKWRDAENALHLKVVVNEELIGYAMVEYQWDPLTPFLAVVIAPVHQRAGYGTETARLLIDYVFRNLPATAVHSWIADWNTPALAFTESLGFTLAGRVRRDGIYDGRFSDSIPVELLREEASRAH